MPIVELESAAARDPRLAAQLADRATSAAPCWLWSTDGPRILWANAVGAAIFGAANAGEGAMRRFDAGHPAAFEIARLAATLPATGQARLERLRGFGASFGGALTCICSRVARDDGPAILVVATEPAGPALTLRERVRRLFADRQGTLAVFAPDGTLLYATEAAQRRIGAAPTLSVLGLADVASRAMATGDASGATPSHGPVTIERIGSEASTALAVTFAAAGEEAAPTPTPAATAAAPAANTTRAVPEEPMAERRHPLRFVWQMDAVGRFAVGSDEFIELMGPRTTAAFGRLWSEIADELKLDPQNQVVRAVATRETWSGITLSWPVDEGGDRLPVELSGLPVFDREREFRGYRGFGVCRDIARINALARARRERPIGFMAPPAPHPESEAAIVAEAEPAAASQPVVEAAETAPRAAPDAAPAAANVVPFRPTAPESKTPSLSPVERKAFRELAQELTARLQGGNEASVVENGAAELTQATPAAPGESGQSMPAFAPGLLDRIPLGVLIYRRDALLYANRHFLELSDYQSLEALAAAGGLNALFADPAADALAQSGGAQSLSVMTSGGERRPVEGRLFTVPWGEGSALALILSNGEAAERRRTTALSLSAAQGELRELRTRLESFKKTEEELRAATREAQKASAAKAEFVAKVSHEIRTPLNTITGFAELIVGERFGPIGNERYREYVKDIHAAGMHLVSLLNDLLDLSKIETGQLDLTFANVSLNELTQQCVGIMQPQASRARIIIRTSLTPGLPQVVADERSLRQIVLNLLSNSIRFTGPGGQVIVSTAFADNGEAVLRVRDTGVGMSEKDVEAALEPFQQTAVAGSWGSGGTGLGLPLTKALAEANRAHFSIKSAPNAGTLVEVAFPPTRVVAG
ncbi:MAG: HAMP domain-containing sensor histidine kinase [Xanthobacteraceae bacterium]|nr:HAMP domain-containing sensor histidine kinase [Xanthobacteraceae bacterium]